MQTNLKLLVGPDELNYYPHECPSLFPIIFFFKVYFDDSNMKFLDYHIRNVGYKLHESSTKVCDILKTSHLFIAKEIFPGVGKVTFNT